MVDFGSALLSAFLQVLFDRVTSREVVEFLLGQRSTDGISKKMEIALLSLNAVLEDAEEKQVAELVVKRWLDELKDAVHDAEDILDEIAAKTIATRANRKTPMANRRSRKQRMFQTRISRNTKG
ncbi:putative disease resistance RPP13-like protein 1 [Morella rubra]|uniref:Putative disease resistance RPP13-like protein 1 n=1 Tax=Morella rubra TaxID=262757 RepID=A0A6A1W6M6_9ROSI|nr:putative disease resistance RPP13-like protein 1 [Morella rubra]